MASVALIGPDGTGKTTIARLLVESGEIRAKYLYMGISIKASNTTLPTSRLVEYLKPWLRKKSLTPSRRGVAGQSTRSRKSASRLWAALRLTNRLAEEWYRQLFSWWYEARGYVVLYDRHFVFDFTAPGIEQDPSLSSRMHRWFLSRFYPRPDLVIYLDAPASLLYSRKQELPVEELERRRQAFIRQGKQLSNFVRVDASQPLEAVYDEVADHIAGLCGMKVVRALRRARAARRITSKGNEVV